MNEARFILSRKIVKEQIKLLTGLRLKISYSYKTNRIVGNILQEICPGIDFSVHAIEETDMIHDKSKIWFFTQAESDRELKEILNKGIKNFVVDNEIDLERVLNVIDREKIKINLCLRMKFQEHRVGAGKYFVYGMSSKLINEIIEKIKNNPWIKKLGVHIHRKSQNTSEWNIREELEDSLTKETLGRIDMLNIGGGLPSQYRSYGSKVSQYIFLKLADVKEFLDMYEIEAIIEPGRFIAAPSVNLETEIIQIQENNIVVNTSIYNCALDSVLTGTKLLVEGELSENEEGKYYLIKGNTPTRDDIFRYKVKLDNPKVGDKIVFLNAGAYNYTTDFCCLKKLKTRIVDAF